MFVGTGKLPRVDGPAQPAEPAAPQLPPEPARHKPTEAPPATGHLEAPDHSMTVESQHQTADHPDLEFAPPPHQPIADHAGEADRPAPLSDAGQHAAPLEAASFAEPSEPGHAKSGEPSKHDAVKEPPAAHGDAKQETAKHELPQHEKAAVEEPRPWLPFSIAMTLLACSLGANIYLGWIAWDARGRYRETVAKLRAAPAS
jgi:hypothetical protein